MREATQSSRKDPPRSPPPGTLGPSLRPSLTPDAPSREAAPPAFAAPGGSSVLRRACSACAKEDEHVIRRAPDGVGHDAGNVPVDAPGGAGGGLVDYLRASAGSGQALDADVRADFERSVGNGLGGVRVVADDAAGAAAESLGARAFTLGSTIWMGRGEYRPDRADGRRLLAHEVAHTQQQAGGAPSIQPELKVGGASDPAEAAADRAADAMLSGAPVGSLGGSDRALRRTCTARTTGDPDERRIDCDGRSWLARRQQTTTRGPRRGRTETSLDGRWNDGTGEVEVDARICHDRTEVLIEPRVPLRGPAQDVLGNVTGGRAPLGGVALDPRLRLQLTYDDFIRLGLEPHVRFGLQPFDYQGAGGTVDLQLRGMGGPLRFGVENSPNSPFGSQWMFTFGGNLDGPGRPIRRPNCADYPPQTTTEITCTPLEQTPAMPEIRRSGYATVYALFEYAQPNIIGWRFESDPTIYAPTDVDNIRQRVTALTLGQSFRPSWVAGYTSPEGPENPGEARTFQGNRVLSQQRAERARDTFMNQFCLGCPTASGGTLPAVGLSELYSPPRERGREARGARLEDSAMQDFLAIDPLRPADPAAFGRLPRAQQVDLTYRMLRRAEIRLERNPVLVPRAPAGERPGAPGPCPAEVRAAAERAFGTATRR